MKIEHIAIWTSQLEVMRDFYTKYFKGTAGERYENPKKKFASYFISYDDECRLEIMQMSGVPESKDDVMTQFTGYIHMAFETESTQELDALTDTFKSDGFEIIDGPRTTGDGYYESVVLDPDGNRVELSYPLQHV